MDHPFAELLDMQVQEQRDGQSRMSLVVAPAHLNPHQVVHGAVLYALVNRGRTVANLDSRIYLGETLLAHANGNYAIFKPRSRLAGWTTKSGTAKE
jgi:acyl-CoA thioesterase